MVRTAQDFAAAGYAEPVQWLEALAGAPETDLGALMEIANALPDQTLALRELAVVCIAGSPSLEGPGAEASGVALWLSRSTTTLNNLGNRLSDSGGARTRWRLAEAIRFTAASPPNGRTRSCPIWRRRSTISAIG